MLSILDKLKEANPKDDDSLLRFFLANFRFKCRGYRSRPTSLLPTTPNPIVIRQDPREVISLLRLMGEHGVCSYAEIGVQDGGLFCLVDSWMRWKGVLTRSVAVDVVDVPILTQYTQKHEETEFRLIKREHPTELSGFDLIFVDTNQRQMGHYLDLYGPESCRLLGFHDTHCSRWGAHSIENIDYDIHASPSSPGIGVINWTLH